MWLIDHSEGVGVEGGCALSHAVCSTETYCDTCQIYTVDQ